MKKRLLGSLLLLLVWGASAPLFAQEHQYARQLKEGMITASKEMIAIAGKIKTVKDAEAAEPKVKKILDNLLTVFKNLADNVEKMTAEDAEEVQTAMNDPEIKKWSDKVTATIDKLKTDHPKAGAKFEEIGKRHSQEFQAVIAELITQMEEKMEPQQSEGEGNSEGY